MNDHFKEWTKIVSTTHVTTRVMKGKNPQSRSMLPPLVRELEHTPMCDPGVHNESDKGQIDRPYDIGDCTFSHDLSFGCFVS